MTYRLGAIHAHPPESIHPLSARATLHAMQPPPRADWFAATPPDGDALANDQFGNCVPCADLRAIQLWRANAHGDTWKPTAADALSLYTLRTGFDPATGMPDDGTITTDDMAAWCRTGIVLPGQAPDVVRWATVDPQDDTHIAIAVAHLGALLVTMNLPAAMQSLSVWGSAPGVGASWEPGSWGMHRVLCGAYDGVMRIVRTWGQDLRVHPLIWRGYVVGCDAALSRNWLDVTGLAPSGLDFAGLGGDLEAVA